MYKYVLVRIFRRARICRLRIETRVSYEAIAAQNTY